MRRGHEAANRLEYLPLQQLKKEKAMAREKGTGSLQLEKSGRWTMRVGIKGKRYSRSTRTTDREKAEKFLERFLSPLGLGSRRLPLADVWLEYVKSPDRRDLAPSTLNAKRLVWMDFARWMEHHHLEIGNLAEVTHEAMRNTSPAFVPRSARQHTTPASACCGRYSMFSRQRQGLSMILGKECGFTRTIAIADAS